MAPEDLTTPTDSRGKDTEYIGDGVYISHDGYQVWLSPNTPGHYLVALEPHVLASLFRYAQAHGFIKP